MVQILRLIWQFLKPAILAFGAKAFRQLLAAAVQYVTLAETARDTPEERRDWVATQLKAADLGIGIPIADSLINLAIELAVQKLKGRRG